MCHLWDEDISSNTRSFVPRSRCDRLIIYLMDSDHRWCDTVCVSDPSEAALAKDNEHVSTKWNRVHSLGVVRRSPMRSKKRSRSCTSLIMTVVTGAGCWTQEGPPCPPTVPKPTASGRNDEVSALATRKRSALASDASLREAESRSKSATPEPEA